MYRINYAVFSYRSRVEIRATNWHDENDRLRFTRISQKKNTRPRITIQRARCFYFPVDFRKNDKSNNVRRCVSKVTVTCLDVARETVNVNDL